MGNGRLRIARQGITALLLSVFLLPQASLLATPAPHAGMSCCKNSRTACCHKRKASSGLPELRAGSQCSRQCMDPSTAAESCFVPENRISAMADLPAVPLPALSVTRAAADSGYLAFLHQRPPPAA